MCLFVMDINELTELFHEIPDHSSPSVELN